MQLVEAYDILNIDSQANVITSMIDFLFESNPEVLIDNCLGRSKGFIFSFVHKYREEQIKITRYKSYDHFRDTYSSKPREAIERLFQEPVGEYELLRLSSLTTHTIYHDHLNDETIRFNKFIVRYL